MYSSQRRSRSVPSLVIVALFAASTWYVVWGSESTDAGAQENPTLVPETPRRDLPRVQVTPPLDGETERQVLASAVVGRHLVVGGNFLDIELSDGSLLRQPYLAAFHLDTGELIERFRPVLDGWVHALEPGPDDASVIVGGAFTRIGGPDGVEQERNRLALLALPDGSVNSSWAVDDITGAVTSLELSGNRLFVGGDFDSLGGHEIENLAEIDMGTGAVRPTFSFDWGGQLERTILTAQARGARLIVGHRAELIDGRPQRGTAVFDISDPLAPRLTEHQMSTGTTAWTHHHQITAASVSPDGSTIALAQGSDTPYVHLIPTAEQPDQLRWSHLMRDSSLAVAVADEAVYVAGTFCMIDAGPQLADPPDEECPETGGVGRNGTAALSLTDGAPLSWNPGANGGARSLTLIGRGLIMGMDGTHANGVNTGAVAFFDRGSATLDDDAPVIEITRPGRDETISGPLEVHGVASDDASVTAVVVRAREIRRDEWVQADGTLGPTPHEFGVELAQPGPGPLEWSTRVPLPHGQFAVEAIAVDELGTRSRTWFARTVLHPDPSPPEVTIGGLTPVPDGIAVLLEGQARDDRNVESITLQVQRSDGQFLALDGSFGPRPVELPTLHSGGPDGPWSWAGPVLAADSYTATVVARDPSGNEASARFELVVAPPVPDAPAPQDPEPEAPTPGSPEPELIVPAQGCVAQTHNGGVIVSWAPIEGVDTYQVRRNGTWVADTGQTSWSEPLGPGDWTYEIRHRQDGQPVDRPCEPVQQVDEAPTCQAVVGGRSVALSWTAVPGVEEYQVRRDAGWLATVTGTSHLDPNAPLGPRTYTVRYRAGGSDVDLSCTPTPVLIEG